MVVSKLEQNNHKCFHIKHLLLYFIVCTVIQGRKWESEILLDIYYCNFYFLSFSHSINLHNLIDSLKSLSKTHTHMRALACITRVTRNCLCRYYHSVLKKYIYTCTYTRVEFRTFKSYYRAYDVDGCRVICYNTFNC